MKNINNFAKVTFAITVISIFIFFISKIPIPNYISFVLLFNAIISITYLIVKFTTTTFNMNIVKLVIANICINIIMLIIYLIPYFKTFWWIFMESAE